MVNMYTLAAVATDTADAAADATVVTETADAVATKVVAAVINMI